MNDQLHQTSQGTQTIDPRSESSRGSDTEPTPNRVVLTIDPTVLRVVIGVLVGLTVVTLAAIGVGVFFASSSDSSTVSVDAVTVDEALVGGGPTLAEIVADQRAYLEAETAATPAQIDCVADALEAMGRERAIEVSLDGIGAAVYVPCGLPD